jgi:transcriptional regulator with XRE-family HTH domain
LTSAVGATLRLARLRAGLSLNQLAARSGGRYRPSSIGGYERGERAISLIRFCELVGLLGVPPDRLLREALARVFPREHSEVLIDLGELPDSDIARQVATYAHEVRSMRGDYRSDVVTLRAGDLQVVAQTSGLRVPQVISALGPAVRRVGPSD